jgi:NAD-dependent dihydropyrimidine dehydrogenase PreA subunit
VGKVKRTGLIEVPLGTTIREVIFDIGGGIADDRKFKAIQTGGPSGGTIPAESSELGMDYESLTGAGSIMGSGGLIVLDEDTCIVDLAHFFLTFTQKESCGKCTPCRVGTRWMLKTLEKIKAGEGEMEDIDNLQYLAETVKNGSLCGLGQTAPNPVLTTLRYFREEVEDHIVHKRCPALVCQALITYSIDQEKCIGCGACVKVCSAGAISGEKKQPHTIDPEKCVRCGLCYHTCPPKVKAVMKTTPPRGDA